MTSGIEQALDVRMGPGAAACPLYATRAPLLLYLLARLRQASSELLAPLRLESQKLARLLQHNWLFERSLAQSGAESSRPVPLQHLFQQFQAFVRN